MIASQRIKELVNVQEFIDKIKDYGAGNIQCTTHTFFRLSEKQREIFRCEDIKEYLLEKVPILVGIQYNGNYAAFYKHKKQRFIRIIVDIKLDRIDVVTFYVIEKNQLPVIRK